MFWMIFVLFSVLTIRSYSSPFGYGNNVHHSLPFIHSVFDTFSLSRFGWTADEVSHMADGNLTDFTHSVDVDEESTGGVDGNFYDNDNNIRSDQSIGYPQLNFENLSHIGSTTAIEIIRLMFPIIIIEDIPISVEVFPGQEDQVPRFLMDEASSLKSLLALIQEISAILRPDQPNLHYDTYAIMFLLLFLDGLNRNNLKSRIFIFIIGIFRYFNFFCLFIPASAVISLGKLKLIDAVLKRVDRGSRDIFNIELVDQVEEEEELLVERIKNYSRILYGEGVFVDADVFVFVDEHLRALDAQNIRDTNIPTAELERFIDLDLIQL